VPGEPRWLRRRSHLTPGIPAPIFVYLAPGITQRAHSLIDYGVERKLQLLISVASVCAAARVVSSLQNTEIQDTETTGELLEMA
jgi:hypothetical protein